MTDRHDLLIEQLASPDPTSRRYAAEDLGDLHDACAVPALVEAVRDPEVAVREAAVDALVVIGGQAVCGTRCPTLGNGRRGGSQLRHRDPGASWPGVD